MERLEPRLLLAADLRANPPSDIFVPVEDLRRGTDVVQPLLPQALQSVGWTENGATLRQVAARPTELVFVDGGIQGYQELVSAAGLNAAGQPWRRIEVIVLDPVRDGVAQMTEALSERDEISAIHILSHGSEGSLQIGNSSIDGQVLENQADKFSSWRDALKEGGDILLYGCNVAGSELGIDFVDRLSLITGADVAASIDVTGAAQLGGDWELEYSTGRIDTALFLRGASGFKGVLIHGIDGGNGVNVIQISPVSIVSGSQGVTGVPYDLQGNPNTAVRLSGGGTSDRFIFTGALRLNGPALAASSISGDGAASATVDFDAISSNLTFTIKDTDGVNPSGISVNNGTFFPKITEVDTIIGGKRTNLYRFQNSWNHPLTIDNSMLRFAVPVNWIFPPFKAR